MILKHNAHDKCIKVKEEDEGIDFYFKNKSNALRLLDFLQVSNSKLPLILPYSFAFYDEFPMKKDAHYDKSEAIKAARLPRLQLEHLQLQIRFFRWDSQDLQRRSRGDPQQTVCGIGRLFSRVIMFEGTFSCDKLPLFLWTSQQKISNVITLIDPLTGKQIEMNEAQYFQYENEINMIPLKGHTTEFMILNVEQEKDKKSINSSIGGYKYKSSTVFLLEICVFSH